MKAIAVDNLHSWKGLLSATNFTERELNYHLMLLFNDNVLNKMDGKYFLIPALESDYKTYFRPKPKAKTISQENQTVKLTPTETKRPTTFLNRKFLVMGIIILLVSMFAIYIYYIGNKESGLNPFDQDSIPGNNSSPAPNSSPESKPSTIHIDKISYCVSVIDGDTIEICSGIRVRLADIDAPESYEVGFESSANALKSIVFENKVYLDIDGKDQYERYICVRYVLSGSRYKNVNYELVSSGYAIYDDYENAFDPNSWSTFESNVDITKADVDSECLTHETPPSSKTYVGSRNSNKYHELSCYWASQIKPENRVYFSSKADAESNGYIPCKVCNP